MSSPLLVDADPLSPTLWAAVSLAMKGFAVLAVAWLMSLTLRRSSAALRHLVWSLALISLLGLPFLSLALPAWPWTFTPWWTQPLAVVGPPSPSNAALVAELPSDSDAPRAGANPRAEVAVPTGELAASPVTTPEETPAPVAQHLRLRWDWLLLVWLAGALLAVAPLVLGWLSLHHLRKRARPIHEGRLVDLLRRLAAQLGLQRGVRLLQSSVRSIPMTWGHRRPVILLPAGAEDWSEERLRMVFLHELAHIKRWDCLTQILAHFVRALHWFNPLVWLAVAAMRTEQERACDDLVLSTGTSAADYAQQLLAITSRRSLTWLNSPVALAIGRTARIERRLASILDSGQRRHPLTNRTAGLALFLTLLMLPPLAAFALRPALASEEAPRAAKEGDPKAEEPPSEQAKKVLEARRTILHRSIKPLDEKELSDGAIRGMIQALRDPYSDYITSDMLRHLDAQMKGSFSGIGAQLRIDNDKKIAVVTALEDSPALKAGLRPGDVILSVDGKPAKGLTLQEVVKLILGPQGSVVKLQIAPAVGVAKEVAIKRARIRVRTVKGFQRGADGRWRFLIDGDNKIGYVFIDQFSASTGKELRDAIKQLQNDGMKGLVLDLRFCPGGLIGTAVEVGKLFVAKGTIVSVKGLGDHQQTWKADGKSTLGDFPLIALVNDHSASAAEVVAGALKDNQRAIVVGTRTYGKASVQELIKLGEGGALKLTTAYYHLPNGRNIQKRPGEKSWGVDPTDGYFIPMDQAQIETLLKRIRQRDILGGAKRDEPRQEKITPEVLIATHADPQLAGALKTMIARIKNGEFVKVGKSTKELADQLARHEELKKKREALLKQLDEVNKELGGANPGKAGGEPPPERP